MMSAPFPEASLRAEMCRPFRTGWDVRQPSSGHRPLPILLLVMLAVAALIPVPMRCTAQQADAHPGNPPSTFLRSTADSTGNPLAVQTAVVRYGRPDCSEDCVTVDLVATVHIADSAYFDRLNSMLAEYDVVLFEMVLPDSIDTKAIIHYDDIPDPSGLRKLYRRFARIIGMVSQHQIDYGAENFVHADLTWEELRSVLAEKGESFPDFNKFAETINSMEAVFEHMDAHVRTSLRKRFATDFMRSSEQRREGTLTATMAFASEFRNARALKLLAQQLDAGTKRIAILYGVSHMPDFQDHLMKEFNLRPLKRLWLDAWDLR